MFNITTNTKNEIFSPLSLATTQKNDDTQQCLGWGYKDVLICNLYVGQFGNMDQNP